MRANLKDQKGYFAKLSLSLICSLVLFLFPGRALGQATLFFDDFNDGNATGWTVLNDSGKASNWQVINGNYNQINGYVGGWANSFHKGSYSYYNNGFALTNYKVTIEVTPVEGGSVGLMFRYQNNNNYYRFSINRDQGFSRLERKLNGAFKTLAYDGRGSSTVNQVHTITIDVIGPKILVYLNGEQRFSASDSNLSSGTIALFTQNNVKFDNVVITESSLAPEVIISSPTSYLVNTTSTLKSSAVAINVPPGGGVKFILDPGTPSNPSFTDFTEPYSGRFSGVSLGNHTVSASIVDSSSTPRAQDTNVIVGVRGNYLVGMGDSITEGVGDDFPNDDNSLDERNLSRGYTPILNDLLSGALNKPITVMNEGLGGTKSGKGSGNGVSRLPSTKSRHLQSQYWLLLFGTNDSGGSMPVPSGKSCTEADFQAGNPSCTGTYKDSMRKLILGLQAAGKVPLLAKVPFILNATSSRDIIIRDYNIVIDDLVTEHTIAVTPPDFYIYFMQHPGEMWDNLHPNGNGYISMASLWFGALCRSGILGIPQPCP